MKLRLDLETGSAKFPPGTVDLADTATDAASPKETPASCVSRNRPSSKLAPVGPTGFIRRRRVLGPFPDYGS